MTRRSVQGQVVMRSSIRPEFLRQSNVISWQTLDIGDQAW